jgi:hypothetical protein
MISSLRGRQYEGIHRDETVLQGISASGFLNCRYHFSHSGSTSKPLAANMPLSSPYISPCLKTKSVTRIAQQGSPENVLYTTKSTIHCIRVRKHQTLLN